jgi:hypothetical protein
VGQLDKLDLSGVIQALSSLDLSAWAAMPRDLPVPAAAVLCVLGLVLCFIGGGRAFRVALVGPAVLAGYLLAPQLAPVLHLKHKVAQLGAAGLLGLLSLFYPPAVLFIAGGTGGALLGGELAGPEDYWGGFVPGFLLAGLLSVVAARIVAVVLSALVGAVYFAAGAVALSAYTPAAGLVASYPILVAGVALVLAVGGIGYQSLHTPSDEDRRKAKDEKARKKRLEEEDRARMKHFEEMGPQKSKKAAKKR